MVDKDFPKGEGTSYPFSLDVAKALNAREYEEALRLKTTLDRSLYFPSVSFRDPVKEEFASRIRVKAEIDWDKVANALRSSGYVVDEERNEVRKND